MTLKEAIYIIDPETQREALKPYALDCQLRQAVFMEACRTAVETLKKYGKRCDGCTYWRKGEHDSLSPYGFCRQWGGRYTKADEFCNRRQEG